MYTVFFVTKHGIEVWIAKGDWNTIQHELRIWLDRQNANTLGGREVNIRILIRE